MRYLGIILSFLLLAGCGDEPGQSPASQSTTERDKKINNTQAASVVGYDGEALQQSVQKMADGAILQEDKLKEATSAAAGQGEPAK